MEQDAIEFCLCDVPMITSVELGTATVQLGKFITLDRDKKCLSNEVHFREVALIDGVTRANIGIISGTITLKHAPRFIQMIGGKNIDGVVYASKSYPAAQVMPARVSDEQVQIPGSTPAAART